MRIALYHDLPSGGAKRAVYEMVRRLVQRHTIEVFSLSTADHNFRDLRPFASHHAITEFKPLPLFKSPLGRLNQIQRWRMLRRFDIISKTIAQQIDASTPDIVFVHPSMWSQAPSVLNFLQAPSVYYMQEPLRISREPVISRPFNTIHPLRAVADGLDLFIKLYYSKLQEIDVRNTLKSERLLANSRFTAGNVAAIYQRQAEVCYLGVDANAFKPMPDLKRERFVLSVGALRANKGFDFLIQALAHIPVPARPPLRIVANADDPQEHSYLQALAKAEGVELVIEGSVSEAQLVSRYNQAALVVYAPVREPFGFVPLEAMACGTAVIGVSEGGVTETVVDGETGQLVPRDAAAFGESVQNLLADRTLCERYGQQGRAYILEQWGWEKSVLKIEAQLTETMVLARGRDLA